jgi:tyrosinase
MPRTRRDVWKLGSDWHDTILWYARGVKALSQRSFEDMTSWRYLAAIHGISPQLWIHNGYLKAGEPPPNTNEFRNEDADQCQHHTWYFLPWHRGYLRAFEKIVADAIAKLSGPKDWALPYWNYNDDKNANRLKLPPAFGSDSWPDGGKNPLYVEARYGDTGNVGGPVLLADELVELKQALTERTFAGTATGGSPGFGGGRTPFKHGASGSSDEGFLEQSPHDNVHGGIGGALANDFQNRLAAGLMSNPTMAALDPIFWLHHANIDRLWEVWVKRNRAHVNPTTDPAWMNGPPVGRPFVMPEPDNKTRTKFFPRELLDTTAPNLDYIYEDDTDPFPGQDRIALRLENLSIAPSMAIGAAMAKEPQVELLGANASTVQLSGPDIETRVRLDPATSRKVLDSFKVEGFAARPAPEPDRIFLNLENITGSSDAVSFNVYVGLGLDDEPKEHPDNLAGVVTLFGLSDASAPAGAHAGNGLNKTLEITNVVDRLHLGGSQALSDMPVRFVLRRGRDADVRIGRISIYRQG